MVLIGLDLARQRNPPSENEMSDRNKAHVLWVTSHNVQLTQYSCFFAAINDIDDIALIEDADILHAFCQRACKMGRDARWDRHVLLHQGHEHLCLPGIIEHWRRLSIEDWVGP